jgi:hypothetical protein
MFAGTIEPLISWTLTTGWPSVSDRNGVLVLRRLLVTTVPNANAVWHDRELEGFVLGTLCYFARE